MKNELFIPYELALVAYEKGFKINNYGIGWYYKRRDGENVHGLDTFYIDTNQNIEQWEKLDEPVEAILYQQITDWLLEKHGILITPDIYNLNKGFVVTVKILMNGSEDFTGNYTHREALNKGIEEAFKLIK